MLIGTLAAFSVDIYLGHLEDQDKINTAKNQIDSISANTKRLLDTTRRKLNIQFDTIASLSKDVRNHVDQNQAQITRQFKDVHSVQGDIRNLVDNTLSSTQKINSIFLKWEFINCADSLFPNAESWNKHAVSVGLKDTDIRFYKNRGYSPPPRPRDNADLKGNIEDLYSFLENLVHAVKNEKDGGVRYDSIPDDMVVFFSLDENYSAVIPIYGNIDQANDLPQLGYEINHSCSLNWFINPTSLPTLIEYADPKQQLTGLLPNVARVLVFFNIEEQSILQSITKMTPRQDYPKEWFSLDRQHLQSSDVPFVKSRLFICPDGDKSKSSIYELLNVNKNNYNINIDPEMNLCDYVVFTYVKVVK